jgi:hypothetical protein
VRHTADVFHQDTERSDLHIVIAFWYIQIFSCVNVCSLNPYKKASEKGTIGCRDKRQVVGTVNP